MDEYQYPTCLWVLDQRRILLMIKNGMSGEETFTFALNYYRPLVQEDNFLNKHRSVDRQRETVSEYLRVK